MCVLFAVVSLQFWGPHFGDAFLFLGGPPTSISLFGTSKVAIVSMQLVLAGTSVTLFGCRFSRGPRKMGFGFPVCFPQKPHEKGSDF